MVYYLSQIKCPICQRLFHDEAKVYIDLINGVLHAHCASSSSYALKDFGAFKDIRVKYLTAPN